MEQLTELISWKALNAHAQAMHVSQMTTLLQSQERNLYSLHQKGLHVDFRYQKMNTTTLELLINLAEAQQLPAKIEALIRGDNVSVSENRPALHTALRSMSTTPILVNGRNITQDIVRTRETMRTMTEKIRSRTWYGFSGKPITDIVNIGVGGSDLGPRFCVNALHKFTASHLHYHFISDADPNAFEDTIKDLNQETTLFIAASKSFTTRETLFNLQKALAWYNATVQWQHHFIAVTADLDKPREFGIQHILPIWNWVGGRFSFCSAINLMGCIAIGYDNFMQLLAGAHHMDTHFRNAPLAENMPVMLGLLGIWNINFLHISNLLLLVYAKELEKFVSYIQQLDMESNGKSIDITGKAVNYATSPIVWGGLGNQAQHSYMQLLCQGSHTVAADFISLNQFNHDMINTVCYAKMRVLSQGVHAPCHHYIPGGMPINHISLDTCSPFNIGLLIALYEHKIYVQSIIWNINAFDQPGVEGSKSFLFAKEAPVSFAQ